MHLEENRTIRSLAEQNEISKAIISIWVKKYREECQNKPELKAEYDYMKENSRLRKELDEKEKEILFLKKAAAFFAKELG